MQKLGLPCFTTGGQYFIGVFCSIVMPNLGAWQPMRLFRTILLFGFVYMWKRGLFVLVFCLLCFLLVYFGMQAYYYTIAAPRAVEENIKLDCEESKRQNFIGRIMEIDRFEENSYMNKRAFNLSIKLNDSLNSRIDYYFDLKLNKELVGFARVGQLMTKQPGKDHFLLTDSVGKTRSFKVPDCN